MALFAAVDLADVPTLFARLRVAVSEALKIGSAAVRCDLVSGPAPSCRSFI
jgi:hypothetical protein